ncbi:MAG: rhodanese-like domain-containing protein [Bacteroidales bacterium]|nr:rhodanese-like domain-containing protein [Bacteroidales bacterium]
MIAKVVKSPDMCNFAKKVKMNFLSTKTITVALGCMLCALPVQAQKVKAKALKPAEFKSLMEQTTNPLIIDIRAAEDHEMGHIEGAIHIDPADYLFVQAVQSRAAATDAVLVYCKLGRTSKSTTALLIQKGFLQVYHLKGGIMAWNKKYPTEASP